MRTVSLDRDIPYRIFREAKDLPQVRRGTLVRARRFQIAPLIQKAIEKSDSLREDLAIPGTPTVGLGQILHQVFEGRSERKELLDPYRVFIRYLAYNAGEVERYLGAKRPRAPYGTELWYAQQEISAKLLPRPAIDRLLEISLYDQSVNGAESGFEREVFAALDLRGRHGHFDVRKFLLGSYSLQADSDMDWGHLYVFEIDWDERGGIKHFEIPGGGHYSFISASFR